MVCCSPVYSSGNHFTPALIADFDQRLPFSTVPERSDVQIVLHSSFSEDGWRNVCAGELDVRPPRVPTSRFGEPASRTELDPFSASINVTAAWPLYWMRRHAEAVVRFREAVTLHPSFWLAHYYLGLTLGQSGSFTEAIAQLQDVRKLGDSPWRLGGLGHADALAGRRDEAYRVVEEAKSLSTRRYVSPVSIASVYAGLGDAEAFEWLEKGFED